jgi:steroid 5-alpha reductase family enzyme
MSSSAWFQSLVANLPYVGVAGLLLEEKTRNFALINVVTQLGVFIPLAHIPCARTGVMSWVDLAWPVGLVVIGVQTFISQLTGTRKGKLAAAMYLLQGGRMTLGAVLMARKGHFKKDLPRYQYQYEQRWAKRGIRQGTARFRLQQHREIFAQAFANMGVLCMPAALTLLQGKAETPAVDALALVLWFASYTFEHVSDLQKQRFSRKCKKQGLKNQVCQDGFWAYTRHPNYFGEWGVWCALTLLAAPALNGSSLGKGEIEGEAGDRYMQLARKALLAASLVGVPAIMYACLTQWTGAVPAEFYSKRKRKGYEAYARAVPMFFPDLMKAFGLK